MMALYLFCCLWCLFSLVESYVLSTTTRTAQLFRLHDAVQPSSPYENKQRAMQDSITIAKLVLAPLILTQVTTTSAQALNFIPNTCSDSVLVLKKGKRQVIMIGTAHISEESVKLVRRTIQAVKPQVVMIELDPKRITRAGLTREEFREAGFEIPEATAMPLHRIPPPSKPSLFKQLFGGLLNSFGTAVKDAGGALLGKALSEFYKSIEKLGFTPGGEFAAAVEEGRLIGARILLGDRDVDITLSRLATAISLTDPTSIDRLVIRMEKLEKDAGVDLANVDTEITKETVNQFVDSMKQKDLLINVMSAIRDEMPYVYTALIGERDVYMAEAVANCIGDSVVGVCGMAHLDGIENHMVNVKGYTVVKRNCPKSRMNDVLNKSIENKKKRQPMLLSQSTNRISINEVMGDDVNGGFRNSDGLVRRTTRSLSLSSAHGILLTYLHMLTFLLEEQ